MSEGRGRSKRKQWKVEPVEDSEQQHDEMDSTPNAADGDSNAGENGVETSQNAVLDDDEQFGCEEVEDDVPSYFTEASDQKFERPGSRKTGRAETRYQKSSVWKYFVQQRHSALCKICKKSFKRSLGSTTNVLQHLRRAHSREYASVIMENSRRKMEEATRHMVSCSDCLFVCSFVIAGRGPAYS